MMLPTLKPYEHDPYVGLGLPVEVVYEGRRIARYQHRMVTLHYYKINTEWFACFSKKPFTARQTVGDTFRGNTNTIEDKVEWASLVKTGRVPDREAAVLLMHERTSLALRKEAANKQRLNEAASAIRNDLQRYRNLYKLANNDNARAQVLAQVISAIVSNN